ncbi:MAG TPA: rod shape-determining protein MreC [Baekduia sp.]|nr:rod shape-determining protein MreC [Baekduia sp.]
MYDKTVRRRRAVLGLLVVSSLILLTAYFREPAGGALHNVQRGILEVVSPIQDGASRALKPVRDLFGWVGDTVSAKGDLKNARAERDKYRAEAIRAQAAVRQNAKLRGQLQLDAIPNDLSPYEPVTARVVTRSPTLWYAKITISKGSSSGIRANQPVIAADGDGSDDAGLIGKVESSVPNSAVVRLITDSSVAVAAMTANGSAYGTVKPSPGNPRDLIMTNVAQNATVQANDFIVTAGTQSRRSDLSSLYPPDLPIGRVNRVEDPASPNQTPHLQPFVDPRQIEYVQVLTKRVNDNR